MVILIEILSSLNQARNRATGMAIPKQVSGRVAALDYPQVMTK